MTDQAEEQRQQEEILVKSETIYEGRIMTLKVNTVELPNRKYAKREIAVHGRGVGILALSDRGTMYMVRQYRAAIDQVLLEIPAGLIDPGESPQEAAIRELQEEIHYKPGQLDYLMDLYSSPGFTNEKMSLFLARSLQYSPLAQDETEFVEAFEYPIEDLFEAVKNFDLVDAKSVIAVQIAYYEYFLPHQEAFLQARAQEEMVKKERG